MIKRVFSTGIALLLFLSVFTAGPAAVYGAAAADGSPAADHAAVVLNGTGLGADAYISADGIFLPLRAVCEALGYTVQWSEKDRSISVSKQGNNILLDVNNNMITANGHAYYAWDDYHGSNVNGAAIMKGRTYMRENFFFENLGLSALWDKQGGTVALTSVKGNEITVKTVKEASENEDIKITLQYPQIEGLQDKAVQDGINAVFSKAAMAAKAEGLKNAEELAKYSAEYPGSPNKCETYYDYRLKYNRNGLLSVVLLDYQYAGGAHGMTVQSSSTFDLKTGKDYELKDLVKSDADYVTPISSIVKAEMSERVKAGILPEYQLSPFTAIKSDQDYYLSDDAVMIYFQQYEYFPYAAGIQEFPIEYAALSDILKPEFGFLNDAPKLLEPSAAQNSLKVGETGRVVLKGNPTTGYTWHYTIENGDVIKLESESATPDSSLTGAGSTFVWDFKAFKPGQTKIVFKYYRDWEGEATASGDNIVEYTVGVNP